MQGELLQRRVNHCVLVCARLRSADQPHSPLDVRVADRQRWAAAVAVFGSLRLALGPSLLNCPLIFATVGRRVFGFWYLYGHLGRQATPARKSWPSGDCLFSISDQFGPIAFE